MNLNRLYKPGGDSKYLKWETLTKESPLKFKLTEEPEKKSFNGKPQWEFIVAVPGGEKKILTLSQRALNALIEAGREAGVQDAMDRCVWTCWKEGDKFETRYVFVATTKGAPTSSVPLPPPPPPPPPAPTSDDFGDEDDLPF